MKNLNSAIKEVLIDNLNKGIREVPIGLIVHELSDPFGNYGFKKASIEKRMEELIKSAHLIKKGEFVRLP